MAIDGVFIKYLVNELKQNIVNKRINKIIMINDHDYSFNLTNKLKLLISLNPNHPHLRLTNVEYLNGTNPLSGFLKHHLESGIINDISQYHNDRIITIKIQRSDELGYIRHYHLHLELTGRTCNLIITNEDNIILEALKKGFFNDGRIIQTKVNYSYPESQKQNPYQATTIPSENIFEGVSQLLFREISFMKNITTVLNRKANPVIINAKKVEYYCFDLLHLEGERQNFKTISEMLDHYFLVSLALDSQNNEEKRLVNFINKEITKLQTKEAKQLQELKVARDNLQYEQIGNILAANIHQVKPYQKEITVYNFYDDSDITIALNTKIPPKENIDYYFNKYKKAKRSITAITAEIEKTRTNIAYYQTLLQQSTNINTNDLKEILEEVGISKAPKRPQKPQLLKYLDDNGNIIWVGKNNIQNNYLTHTIANRDDYFFHVKDYPGSHVIFRGNLDNDAIILAATIASYYSKAQGRVSVDYTQVKYVKKVKGQPGSFVRYTNQKSITVTGDLDYIKAHTTLDK